MLIELYDTKLLNLDRDDPIWLDPPELYDMFTDFVQGQIDVVYDLTRYDMEEIKKGAKKKVLAAGKRKKS